MKELLSIVIPILLAVLLFWFCFIRTQDWDGGDVL
jgi:preprotein translocase subunit YajC